MITTQLNRCSGQTKATNGRAAEELPTTVVGIGGTDQTEGLAPSPMPQQIEVGARAADESMASPGSTRKTEEEVGIQNTAGDDVEVRDAAHDDVDVGDTTQGDEGAEADDDVPEDVEVEDAGQEDVDVEGTAREEDNGANP